MTDYAEYAQLSADAIAKQINDEYSVILASEKANLPRALTIGEKLIALRGRTVHGQWQAKLKTWCPQISYETATLYIRLYEKQDVWRTNAAAKSVETTDLTIEAARQLLAKPKSESDDEVVEEEETDDNADTGPVESEEEVIGKEWLGTLAPDELVKWLKEIHGVEYLKDLAKKLAAELAKALQPTPQVTMQPLASSVGSASGFDRRA